jgi:hypothetical protein
VSLQQRNHRVRPAISVAGVVRTVLKTPNAGRFRAVIFSVLRKACPPKRERRIEKRFE